MADKITTAEDRNARQAELHFNKTASSMKEFKNARVTSCSAVLSKCGQTVAISFPQQAKATDLNALKSGETTSFAQ